MSDITTDDIVHAWLDDALDHVETGASGAPRAEVAGDLFFAAARMVEAVRHVERLRLAAMFETEKDRLARFADGDSWVDLVVFLLRLDHQPGQETRESPGQEAGQAE